MNQKNNSVTSAETKDEVSANVEVSTSSPNNAKPNVGGCGLKPMLFSTEMVKAILDGRKSQTRRIVKYPLKCKTHHISIGKGENAPPVSFSPFEVGQTLWVRETFCSGFSDEQKYHYKANDKNPNVFKKMGWKWKPSLFMPYDACRLFLKITNIRVERLQSISEQDAINEGYNSNQPVQDPYLWYRNLWSKINSVEIWLENPFVWVIEFERCVKP